MKSKVVMNTLSLLKGKSNIMDIQATKLDVVQKILSVSKASLLEKINDILDSEMIVAYTVDGKPLTRELYNKRLQESEKQLLSGEYTTQEDLEKESESW
jgi:hypothetical protein